MTSPGVGAMIHALGGGSQLSPADYYGKKIKAAELKEGSFNITFDDCVRIAITDEGQSCCESRYMVCDDNPNDLVGKTLRKIDVKEVKEKDTDDGAHEIAFLEIAADDCSVTLATHNEHNGYYGGFGLNISELSPEQ